MTEAVEARLFPVTGNSGNLTANRGPGTMSLLILGRLQILANTKSCSRDSVTAVSFLLFRPPENA
jgi:hypothetical protein